MLQVLQANGATILVILLLALMIFFAVRKIVKDKKAGIGPCGQRCSDCAFGADCQHLPKK